MLYLEWFVMIQRQDIFYFIFLVASVGGWKRSRRIVRKRRRPGGAARPVSSVFDNDELPYEFSSPISTAVFFSQQNVAYVLSQGLV